MPARHAIEELGRDMRVLRAHAKDRHLEARPLLTQRIAIGARRADYTPNGTTRSASRSCAASGRGRATSVTGVEDAQKKIAHLVMKARLPNRGDPRSDSAEGDVSVRDPDADVVKAAVKTIIDDDRHPLRLSAPRKPLTYLSRKRCYLLRACCSNLEARRLRLPLLTGKNLGT